MTDNQTTELLREGLTERGIEWRSGIEGVTFVGDWCFVEYDNGKLAATCEPVLTPEQAIAATLGRGTLTADDVLNAVYKHGARWQAIADELNDTLGSDDEYEAKMDELLCYLTNGKFSKSRQYSLDFMKACVDEEYEDAYNELNAELGSGKAKDLLLRTFGLAQMMHDCWLEECKAGDNVDVSACNAYSYEFDQIAQAMFDMGTDPNDSDYYRSVELGSGTCHSTTDGSACRWADAKTQANNRRKAGVA